VVGIESAQHWISIDRAADYGATLTAIRETIDDAYPGFNGVVQTYRTDLTKSLAPRATAPLAVRVQGLEREGLREQGQKVAKMLAEIPGIRNARVEGNPEVPQIQIKVDMAAASRVGLKPGDVRRAAATVFGGLEVGNLYEQQKVFEVVVWGAPEVRRSLSDVENLLIDTPADGYVRLADVAEVRMVPTPIAIEREGVSRRIHVYADIAGGNTSAIARQVRERLQKHEFPLEYHAVVLETRQASYWQALIGALAAAIGMYLILQACFRSWRLASLLASSIVAAVLGGLLLATLVTGGTVLLGSLLGCIAVLSLAVHHGIPLIQCYRRLEREQVEPFGPGLVVRGTRERLPAILTSAAAIAAAVLPFAVSGTIAGLEILHPMAVVVLGGLLVSVIIHLFLIPGLYLRIATPQPKGMPEVDGSEQYA
jgi:Cu/Ag efflux pump CusA